MHDASKLASLDGAGAQQPVYSRHRAARGIGGRRQLLVADLAAGGRVMDDDVGERAADVDAHGERALQGVSP